MFARRHFTRLLSAAIVAAPAMAHRALPPGGGVDAFPDIATERQIAAGE